MNTVSARSTSNETKAPAAPPPAGRGLFFAYTLIGAFSALAGSFALLVLSTTPMLAIGVLEICLGVWFFGSGVYGLAAGRAGQTVNRSLNLIGQGKLREAEALLDGVSSSRIRAVQRVAFVQRALIALRRGDLVLAAAASDAAVRVPLGWWNRVHAMMHKANAHGIRALVRASASDGEGARADIAEVKRDLNAPPQAIARAALAEALLSEKDGDRAALASVLRRERRLLLDATDPRERAIVRGLQRLLRTPQASVYRKQAEVPRTPEGAEEPALSDWMRAVAPEVAPFVGSENSGASARNEEKLRASSERFDAPSDAARAAITADRDRAAKDILRAADRNTRTTVALLVALLAVFAAAAYKIVRDSPELNGDGEPPPIDAFSWAPVALSVVLGAAALRLAARVRQARRQTQELTRIATQMLRGDREGAARALETLTKSPGAFVAAQAELFRSFLAERRGDFEESLARCDAALGRLGRYGARVLAADLLAPEIAAARAVALASLGRADEASAEIAALPPAYPFLARARFRAELHARLKKGDHAGAAAVAASAPPDLPIGPRDELLRDLVRATVAPEAAGSAEIERLKDELREGAEDRVWLDTVAPELRAAFEKATTAEANDAGEAEREAEMEALAEAESASAAAQMRR